MCVCVFACRVRKLLQGRKLLLSLPGEGREDLRALADVRGLELIRLDLVCECSDRPDGQGAGCPASVGPG